MCVCAFGGGRREKGRQEEINVVIPWMMECYRRMLGEKTSERGGS